MLIDKKKCMLNGTCVSEIKENDYSVDGLVTQYQHMVEKLLWTIEVKRVDLTAEVSIKLKTTKGYEFLVLWEDGSTDWIPLKDMYASNPLETAEFAAA